MDYNPQDAYYIPLIYILQQLYCLSPFICYDEKEMHTLSFNAHRLNQYAVNYTGLLVVHMYILVGVLL